MTADLVEIFCSVQGEGPYTGVRQVFIRFSGCNLACSYCDTEHAASSVYRVEDKAGFGQFRGLDNPASPEQVADIIKEYNLHKVHSVVLTGGEPLLHSEFIGELGHCLQNSGRGGRLYLETNGTLPEHLKEVIDRIDIVSMDMKLPSATMEPAKWNLHREFLAISSRKEVFVKVVVVSGTTDSEIVEVCRLLKEVDPEIPLILQPMNSILAPWKQPQAALLTKLQGLALDYLGDVRIMPQAHKILGHL